MPTLSRPGQNLGAGDENAKFLQKFTGEVLAEFEETNLLMGLTRVKTISWGKSALFAALGKATATRHVAGEDVIDDPSARGYLSNIKSTDREIFVDDPLTSSVLVADIDQLKQHWEARREYTEQLGRALAFQADKDILATIITAAHCRTTIDGTQPWGRANATRAGDGRLYGGVAGVGDVYSNGFGGSPGDASDAGAGANVVKFAFAAAETLDRNRVPMDERYLVLRPKQYYLLAQVTDVVSSDFTSGANGGLDSGRVMNVAGFRVVKSANFKTTNTTLTTASGLGVKNDLFDEVSNPGDIPSGAALMYLDGAGYDMNMNSIGGIAFHRSCVGTVKLADVGIETSRETRNRADLVVADYAMGHNVLRPEAACAWIECTNVL